MTLIAGMCVRKGQFAKVIGAFVPKVTAVVFQKFGFHSAEIMASWSTIVGGEVAHLTRPESIKWPWSGVASVDDANGGARSAGATLIVATSPAFALEVSYRHKEIIDRTNRYFGYRAIAQLKVRQVPQLDGPAVTEVLVPAGVHEERILATPRGDHLAAALKALGRSIAATNAR